MLSRWINLSNYQLGPASSNIVLAGRNEMKWNKKGSKSEKEEEKKRKENQIHTYNKQIEKKLRKKKKERLNPWLEP